MPLLDNLIGLSELSLHPVQNRLSCGVCLYSPPRLGNYFCHFDFLFSNRKRTNTYHLMRPTM